MDTAELQSIFLFSLAATNLWQWFGAFRAFRPVRGSMWGFVGILPFASFYFVWSRCRDGELSVIGVVPALVVLVGALYLFEWGRRAIRGQYFSYLLSDDIPKFVSADGPFHYIRNPFYSSYWLTSLAGLLAVPDWWTALTVVLMAVYFGQVARFEERKFTRSPVADSYAAYKARTGRFLPKLGGA